MCDGTTASGSVPPPSGGSEVSVVDAGLPTAVAESVTIVGVDAMLKLKDDVISSERTLCTELKVSFERERKSFERERAELKAALQQALSREQDALCREREKSDALNGSARPAPPPPRAAPARRGGRKAA